MYLAIKNGKVQSSLSGFFLCEGCDIIKVPDDTNINGVFTSYKAITEDTESFSDFVVSDDEEFTYLDSLKKIEQEYKDKIKSLKEGYSEEEVLTWGIQFEEAKNKDSLFIRKMAEETGEDFKELAKKIKKKGEYFKEEVAAALAIKRKKIKELETKYNKDV